MASSSAPITVNGNADDNNLQFQDPDNDVIITGGLGEDTIGGGAGMGPGGFSFALAENATIYGGEGVTSPEDDDDSIAVLAETALVYGNGGDDFLIVGVEDSATIAGGLGDDFIDTAGIEFDESGIPMTPDDQTADILVYGGEGEDQILVEAADDVTVFGGVGVTDPLDGDDTINVGTFGEVDTALIYGNGGDDIINVGNLTGDATVFGGAGDDSINVTFVEAGESDVSVAGGSDDDLINIGTDGEGGAGVSAGDVTVFGGEGVTSPVDGEDTINVFAENATVYGNGDDDELNVNVSESASVFGGIGDDSITVTRVEGEDAANTDAILVFGNEGEDEIEVTTDTDQATVSGGSSLTATDATEGDDLTLTHTGTVEGGSFLMVGSSSDDAFSFTGLDGDQVEIRLGGNDDDTVVINGQDVTIDDELDEDGNRVLRLDGVEAEDAEFDGDNVTFTVDDDGATINVFLVGIQDFEGTNVIPPVMEP